jgi:tRNA/tmRNA/rRNA uracil-C5-methylase (TrmA/RlmC/RlmD family)
VPALTERWGEESFEVGGAAFLQVNREAAALLEAYVEELAGDDLAGRAVVDAYCGIGTRARELARKGARVTGIELDASAVAIAESFRTPGAVFRAERVEDGLAAALPADLVVLNPPRAGVDPAVTAALNELPPERIVYVSCDPATLSRDIARLGERYELRSVRCFDLFPQTAHVETVVELVRKD